MTLDDILQRLEGVNGSNGQYTAKCPAHDDNKASLSISQGESRKILLHCHAGCELADICEALSVKPSDLFQEPIQPQTKRIKTAEYVYTDLNNKPLYKKVRYSDKSFCWLHPSSGGSWEKGRNGAAQIYNQYATQNEPIIFIVEGEKDVETLKTHNMPAVSLADGAKSKWRNEYGEFFKGKTVKIIPDNDKPGRDYADMIAEHLQPIAKAVQLVDLSKIWQDMPDKADITDYFERFGKNGVVDFAAFAMNKAEEWRPKDKQDDNNFLACFKTLDNFNEEEAKWLVKGWIPEGQITYMAADGGVGKTSLWCNIVAAFSSGKACILDPPDTIRAPQKVAFLTTEDSVRKKLKGKLRVYGATPENIITPDFLADKENLLRALKFGSKEIEQFISAFKPVLCVFDPVQGFVPPDINMGSRNAMRDCLAPLISIGEEYGCTFLIVGHSNKRKGAFGRDRCADSADLWDIARSVAMVGFTEDSKIRYLSNEKNNYSELQRTVLFSFDENGVIKKEGETWKRDREYVQDFAVAQSKPKREECKKFIMDLLHENNGKMKNADLEAEAKKCGFSDKTIRNSKTELKDELYIKMSKSGFEEKTWYIEESSRLNI